MGSAARCVGHPDGKKVVIQKTAWLPVRYVRYPNGKRAAVTLINANVVYM